MSARIRIDEVVGFLGVETRRYLVELRREGLFERDELEPEEVEELRIALDLMRDLDVNAPGVDVALHLRRRLLALESRMAEVLRRLLEEREGR